MSPNVPKTDLPLILVFIFQLLWFLAACILRFRNYRQGRPTSQGAPHLSRGAPPVKGRPTSQGAPHPSRGAPPRVVTLSTLCLAPALVPLRPASRAPETLAGAQYRTGILKVQLCTRGGDPPANPGICFRTCYSQLPSAVCLAQNRHGTPAA